MTQTIGPQTNILANRPTNTSTNTQTTISDNLSDEELVELGLRTNYRAGRYIRAHAYDEDLEIRWKKLDDPVTKLDTGTELMQREDITENVDATIYGEEFPTREGKSGITAYIDPIDGTKSFIKKEFHTSSSLAIDRNGKLVFGSVYDFMRDLMYYADSNGAYLITPDGKKNNLPLNGMPIFSKPNIDVKELDDIYANNLDVRFRKQSGSIALSMVQLAQGSYNGLILSPLRKEGKSDTCDIAAGYYIMKQSGLYIADYGLEPFDYKNPTKGIIALDSMMKNGSLGEMRKILEDEKHRIDAKTRIDKALAYNNAYINGHDEECMVAK